jgi:FeS assembly SUF system protein
MASVMQAAFALCRPDLLLVYFVFQFLFSVPVFSSMNFINHTPSTDSADLETRVIEALKTCYDPEIPVDIYELGLIYTVTANADSTLHVEMTLTSPNCPAAGSLPGQVEELMKGIDGMSDAVVDVVFEPTWDKSMM